VCLFCADQLGQIPCSLQLLRKRNRPSTPRFLLLRRCRLRAILAGFGMGTSFLAHAFLVVLISPAQS
jgi:hypothetical protein